jgi:hypothetical protein
MRLSSVVLPAPRKPVRIVVGIIAIFLSLRVGIMGVRRRDNGYVAHFDADNLIATG